MKNYPTNYLQDSDVREILDTIKKKTGASYSFITNEAIRFYNKTFLKKNKAK